MKKTQAAAIREALKETDSPAKVIAILKQRGIWETPEYVSLIKRLDSRSAMTISSYCELMQPAMDLVLAVGADEAEQLITGAAEIVEYIKALRRFTGKPQTGISEKTTQSRFSP